MKNFLLSAFVLFFLSTGLHAQKVYFIFLQSENNKPFFVKMADKIYSSSTSGYLIIPDLKESNYNFKLGFADQSKPEADFSVEITNTDRGLLIKNTDEGINLFDLQSLALYKPVVKDVGTVQQTIKKTDSFTQLLSKAADDESILSTTVTKKIEPPVVKEATKTQDTIVAVAPPPINTPDTIKSVVVNVQPPTVKEPIVEEKKVEAPITTTSESTPIVPVVKEEPKSTTESPVPQNTVTESSYTQQADSGMEPFKKSVVTKRSESSTTEGFGLVFLDNIGSSVDTIRLLIPNPKIVFSEEIKQPTDVAIETVVESSQIKSDDNVAEEPQKRGLLAKRSKGDKSQSPSNEKKDDSSIQTDEGTRIPEADPATKPDGSKGLLERLKKSDSKESAHTNVNGKTLCAAFANDNDFMKLRRNMAAKTTDDAMVDEAKKLFKSKCFTTEQIKNLSYLFLSPAGKYQFFDVAYTYAVDQWQFKSLESEIKDEYYQKRFKALIGE